MKGLGICFSLFSGFSDSCKILLNFQDDLLFREEIFRIVVSNFLWNGNSNPRQNPPLFPVTFLSKERS